MQNISGKLFKAPTVNLIIKTEQSFSDMDAIYFAGRSYTFYCPSVLNHSGMIYSTYLATSLSLLGSFFPAELQMIAQSPTSGHLRAFTLSLDDLCESSFRLLRADRIASWEGPRNPIKSLASCNDIPYHAIAGEQQVVIWNSLTDHVFVLPKTTSTFKPQVVKWSPSGK
jgi:hypothetical protein